MTGHIGDVDPQRPQSRADLSVYPLDDELIIYDPRTGESFVLNPTGRLVWERCDGTHTLTEIARELAAIHGISDEQARTDSRELLDSFARASLLNL